MLACVLQYNYKLFIIFASVLHKDILTCKHIFILALILQRHVHIKLIFFYFTWLCIQANF